MEKTAYYIPLTNILFLIFFAAVISIVNDKNENIPAAIFVIFTISMMAFPDFTIRATFGLDAISRFGKILVYFAGSMIILQQHTWPIFRDLTIGLSSIGYRAIGLLINSLRSLS